MIINNGKAPALFHTLGGTCRFPGEELIEEIRAAANRFYRQNPDGVQHEDPPPGAKERVSGAGHVRKTYPPGYESAGIQANDGMQQMESAYYFLSVPQAKGSIKPAAFPDITSVRRDFPVLSRRVNGKPLIWLDNAATTQKPQCVIDALSRYYSEYNSNIHRGAHTLARQATEAYEEAREKVRRFIGAAAREEVIFVRGTTEAVNLVASSWGAANIGAGDEIILTEMEHHSNIVPWQMLAEKTGAYIKTAPVNASGEIDIYRYELLFTPRTRIVAAAHVSNVLGTVNPVRVMADIAHRHGALILVDGAQSAPHMPVDVRELDADFFAFSGHKTYGPTGIGVLYGKQELLEQMPPYQGGGGMIESVSFSHSAYKRHPDRFEAGTGNIADAVGLGASIDYLQSVGMERIRQYESELTRYLMNGLRRIPGVRMIGTSPGKTSVVSFVIDAMEPAAIAKALDQNGIAIRSGHHCAQPVLAHFGLEGTARASIGLYNTFEEMDTLIKTVSGLTPRY